MKSATYLYLKLLWPIFLADFLCVTIFIVILSPLFPVFQVHFAYLNVLACIILIWILSYRVGVQTKNISTGIFLAIIYVFIWRFPLIIFIDYLMDTNYYAAYTSQLKYLIFGVSIFFLIGVPIVSLLSWPAAYLGHKRTVNKKETPPLNQKENQRPWISIAILFYIRTIVILFVLYTLYNVWGHEAFKCNFIAWSLPSCSCKPGYGSFLVYSFILLLFNVVLICVDTALGHKSFSSKTLLAVDFILAAPAWLLTGLTQSVICSLPFVTKASMWLINNMRKGLSG